MPTTDEAAIKAELHKITTDCKSMGISEERLLELVDEVHESAARPTQAMIAEAAQRQFGAA